MNAKGAWTTQTGARRVNAPFGGVEPAFWYIHGA